MADYEITAELRLAAHGATTGIAGLADRLRGFSQSLSGAQSGMGSMVRQALALGGAYVGFQAMSTAFRGIVGSAVEFQTQLEGTRIGLQAVAAQVEGMPFAEAASIASTAFQQLTEDAIRSTATTQQLFGIYQQIYGPIRAAGAGMDVVRELTNNTVAAAGALNVDFAQASRDINAMLRGSAGLDVKLFSMLRSTGAIAENAEAFNQLSSAERVAKLRAALGGFSAAADAYGRSWAGVTSTFTDIVDQFRSAAFSPIFDRVKNALAGVNDLLIRNRDRIKDTLQAVGIVISKVLGRVFSRIQRGFEYIGNHWDEILGRVRSVVGALQAMLPRLLQAAKVFAAVQIGRRVLGSGLGIAASGVGGIASIAGVVSKVLPLLTGGMGLGGAAAEAGGAAAGAGGLGAAALPLLLAAIPVVLAAFAALAAVLFQIGAVVYVAYQNWGLIQESLTAIAPAVDALWIQLQRLGAIAWEILQPILELVGQFIIIQFFKGLQQAFEFLIPLVMGFIQILTEIKPYILAVVAGLQSMIPPLSSILGIAQNIGGFGRGMGGGAPAGGNGNIIDRIMKQIEMARSSIAGGDAASSTSATAPGERARTVNDFRGSRITVHQEFREADPDRVAIDMMNDLARAAEQRVQSGFTPALTR